MGDGDPATADFAGKGSGLRREAGRLPLHEAIKRFETGDRALAAGEREGFMNPASVQQSNELALWLVNRIFADAWRASPYTQPSPRTFAAHLMRSAHSLISVQARAGRRSQGR